MNKHNWVSLIWTIAFVFIFAYNEISVDVLLITGIMTGISMVIYGELYYRNRIGK